MRDCRTCGHRCSSHELKGNPRRRKNCRMCECRKYDGTHPRVADSQEG